MNHWKANKFNPIHEHNAHNTETNKCRTAYRISAFINLRPQNIP